MEENDLNKQWQEIIEISESMLSAAQNARWDPLIELESTRQILLERFFENEMLAHEVDIVKQGIHFILKSDKEISGLVMQQSAYIKDELSQLKNNRTAISQYNQFSR